MQDVCTTDLFFSMSFFDYTRTTPCIVQDDSHWAVVYKPPHLPTAPLQEGERETLVHWFLNEQPQQGANQVHGKKRIEAGLLHRLDTDTRGLVLFAKDQITYDFFSAQQMEDRMIKTYYAFVTPDSAHQVTIELPYTITSQFRNFGPGAKRTAAVFPHSRHYRHEGRLYTTTLTTLTITNGLTAVQCSLSRGYRHQVRVHLATLGMPIAGDPLYSSYVPTSPLTTQPYGLQLYAVSLSFPNPKNPQQSICVALPLPDKMNP